jgi:predicted signal transduction protein with EAL and GGDEF domain
MRYSACSACSAVASARAWRITHCIGPKERVAIVSSWKSDPDDVAIVQAIISLGHNLGLRVVAEGVQTEGQLAFLVAKGCDEMQGYFFSRPLPAKDIQALLQEGRRPPESLLQKQRRQRTSLLADDDHNIVASLQLLLRREAAGC